MKTKRYDRFIVSTLILTILAVASLIPESTFGAIKPEEKKIQGIISKMTLEQKVHLVVGTGMFFDLPDSIKAKLPPGFGGPADPNDKVYSSKVDQLRKYLPGAAGV